MDELKRTLRARLSPSLARCGLLLAGLSSCLAASGTELVYAPINPSFVGGNPNNASALLSIAGAQNGYKPPTLTPLQNFNNALQQAILNRLSSQALTTIFGKNSTLVPGTYDTAGYSISITDTGNGNLQVTTTDKTTGAQVSFSISSTDLNVTGP
ncbi:MAG: curli assembly protein CsgF [Paucibacter sp.]|nr:curli assembly protein CsgF [Roseateles sp.]